MKISNAGLWPYFSIFLVTGVLLIAHYAVRFIYWPQRFDDTPFWSMYLFLVPMSLATLWFVRWRFGKDHQGAGKSYFITVFVKMFASAFFLYPGVMVERIFLRETAVQFLTIFFVLLFVETWLLIRLLNRPLGENLKNDENQ